MRMRIRKLNALRIQLLVSGCLLFIFAAKFFRMCIVLDVAVSHYNNLCQNQSFVLDIVEDGVTNLPLLTATNRPMSAQRKCPREPTNLTGKVEFANWNSQTAPYIPDIIKKNPEVMQGGHYSPRDCLAHNNVAIIIPLRGRFKILSYFLSHMHPILQRQQLEYTVFVITQSDGPTFNKAKLMNVGVAEARKHAHFDCFVFHDVDVLPEDDRCLYSCHKENPRHLAMHIDKFSYKPVSYRPYCLPLSMSFRKVKLFGGATMFTPEQFDKVNGFSTLYWGWGGEDDDMYLRLRGKGFSASNPYGTHCSYRTVNHIHESSNPRNPARHSLVMHAISRQDREGYRTTRYKVLSVERTRLYTNITVDVGIPSPRMVDFMSQSFNWFTRCIKRMPWNL